MRVTTFALDHEEVAASIRDSPDWQVLTEYDGQPLNQVDLAELRTSPRSTMQLVRICAGGSFVMHTGPELAFCQIVEGRGRLGLPDGRALDYAGPELYIFEPGALHDWHDVSEDTLLSVCLITEEVA